MFISHVLNLKHRYINLSHNITDFIDTFFFRIIFIILYLDIRVIIYPY